MRNLYLFLVLLRSLRAVHAVLLFQTTEEALSLMGLSRTKFITVAPRNSTLNDMFNEIWRYNDSIVAAFVQRASQYEFSNDGKVYNTLTSHDIRPLKNLNTLANAHTHITGRNLPVFTIIPTARLSLCTKGVWPCAIWDASSGRVWVDENLLSTHAHIFPTVDCFIRNVQNELEKQVFFPVSTWQGAITSISAAAYAALLYVYSPSLWWCLACPTVLGLLAPFLINYGLTAIAQEICDKLDLPSDECADLWWGAFALAMVLSLGSAFPIEYICRLPECGRHLFSS